MASSRRSTWRCSARSAAVTNTKSGADRGASRWLQGAELRPLLAEGLELAEDKSEFIITRDRDASQNLRTTFEKLIKRAVLVPWPKLFQNMRSSRETELVETYPVHVVTAWLGNTASVAAKHYLQTTEEHFEKAVQNPVQQVSAIPRNAPLVAPHDVKKPQKHGKPMFLRV